MDRWVENLTPAERAELTDAGRLGAGRFESFEPLYARHIANPDMTLLIVEQFDNGVFLGHQRTRALLKYPGKPIWYSGDLLLVEGRLTVAGVNQYASETEARTNAKERT